MLNSTELLSYITNVNNLKCIQQVGIDLELIEVKRYLQGRGMILKDKTILPQFETINLIKLDEFEGWLLDPGYYDLKFKQGCKLTNDVSMRVCQRSSLLRSCAKIQSSIFDPGFETDFIGSFMQVIHPIFIEYSARVAQIYGFRTTPVSDDKIYNGQFQKK